MCRCSRCCSAWFPGRRDRSTVPVAPVERFEVTDVGRVGGSEGVGVDRPPGRVLGVSVAVFLDQAVEGLEELAETTGQAALLAVWSNSGPTVVRMERGPNLTTTSIGLGSTFPLLDSATGRVFLSYLPRQQLMLRLQLELNRAAEAGISWPDLSPDLGSVQALKKKIRRERIAQVDGRFIPGLNAISSAITNWQEEIEVAVTLFGTHRELMEPGSPTRKALVEFASRHSIIPPEQLSNGRSIRAQ